MDTLRLWRRRKGWTQGDLARKAGVHLETVSGIEGGRHEPRPSTLKKLAGALGVEVEELFEDPKADTPFSPEVLEAEDDEHWELRAHDFLLQFPSETERIPRIERVVGFYRGLVDRWRREMELIEEEGADPCGKHSEMCYFRSGLTEALKKDGIYDYLMWVLVENPSVSEQEREACIRFDACYAETGDLVQRMGEIEQVKRLFDVSGLGLEATQEFLADQSETADGGVRLRSAE